MNKIKLRIINKESGNTSNPVELEEIILNQRDVCFEFKNGDILPYKDFLFYRDEYYYELLYHELIYSEATMSKEEK